MIDLIQTTVPIGLERPVKVLHVTDTHLPLCNADDEPQIVSFSKYRGNPAEIVASLQEQLAYAQANCDLLLHTGDLIDFASGANVAYAREFLKNDRILFIAGNHEYWHCDGKFEDQAYRINSYLSMGEGLGVDMFFTSRVVGGINFVGLDDGYHLAADWQTERLRMEVEKGLPVVLFLHAPLFEQELYEKSVAHAGDSTAYLVGCDEAHLAPYSEFRAATQRPDAATRAFVDYVNSETRIKAVIAGHVHISFESRLPGGTMQYVTDCGFKNVAREITFI